MRILILGAGGIGGYYGARLQKAGGDVSFLVRPPRAAQLKSNGLKVYSSFGDIEVTPKVVTAETLRETYDVIILSCKAFDLDSAIAAIAPAVGEHSVVIPLLNGVRHMETLVARFGAARVLGGVAAISVMLGADGEIRHMNKMHRLITGATRGQSSKWLNPIAQLFSNSGFDFALSENIEQAMWDKIVFLTTLAGATCTMRASVGTVLETVAGTVFIDGLLDECAKIADACAHPVAAAQIAAYRAMLNEKGSGLMASMLRDVEKGGPTEAEHIVGDMVARAADKRVDTPLLRLAYSHLQAYELRRKSA
jgi:2-dehydropantoate 2-reductase